MESGRLLVCLPIVKLETVQEFEIFSFSFLIGKKLITVTRNTILNVCWKKITVTRARVFLLEKIKVILFVWFFKFQTLLGITVNVVRFHKAALHWFFEVLNLSASQQISLSVWTQQKCKKSGPMPLFS